MNKSNVQTNKKLVEITSPYPIHCSVIRTLPPQQILWPRGLEIQTSERGTILHHNYAPNLSDYYPGAENIFKLLLDSNKAPPWQENSCPSDNATIMENAFFLNITMYLVYWLNTVIRKFALNSLRWGIPGHNGTRLNFKTKQNV